MRKIKVVMFDLGDTLLTGRFDHYQTLLKKHHVTLQKKEFVEQYSKIFHTRVWKKIDRAFKMLVAYYRIKNSKNFQCEFRTLWNDASLLRKYKDVDLVLTRL